MDKTVAALPLRGLVLLPGALRAVSVGRPSSVAAIEHHLTTQAPLVAAVQRDPELEQPLDAEIAEVGVLCVVNRATRVPDGGLQILLEGTERVRMDGPLRQVDDMTVATIVPLPGLPEGEVLTELQAKALELGRLYVRLLTESGMTDLDPSLVLSPTESPERLSDQICGQLEISWDDRLKLLEELDLSARIDRLTEHCVFALAAQRFSLEVNAKVQAAMDKSQREYHLREQLKIIRAELGDHGVDAEADAFQARLEAAELPPEVRKEALREVERLRRIHVDSAEYSILRTWLEAVCDLPWQKSTEDTTDLSHAQKVLDEDHFGLESVKERILEYLAVRRLKPDSKGPILCFVGPPGVGKTSLGRSIARALGRSFGRIALGGVKDETEIRGHRRTYVGALPGRITRALSRAGTCNPVLVLDELDKVGNDVRGDPASALLEVLDAEQNTAFIDHYLDIPVDLSQVLFIGTANVIDTIPAPLQDRLEIIEIPGYIEEEKVAIARRFLLPRISESHGLNGKNVTVTTGAVERVIQDYTREAGLRELDRQLAKLHRKVARKIVEGHQRGVRITQSAVPRYLGPQRFFSELAERVDQPGVVIGLAWTASGGDILFIECTRMAGKGNLKLTGSLGAVMKESAEAAMSWLRTHAHRYQIEPETFEGLFHLHVPAGAIPKDGPSAGVTMVAALASVCTGRKVRAQIGMTGEITLRGKVLPVGGVKEKVLAARRAGVKQVILPRHNRNDLEDVPEVLRRDLQFHFVDTIPEVLELALAPAEGP
ncbi:MAG: endopeptidase La [Deltaproteobacteria bacterium]|nr:MAG: endopeptidase La [Deltaproteobacteria bacterium]